LTQGEAEVLDLLVEGRANRQIGGGRSAFQACVIQRESGGDPSAVNPSSGAGGLYGFLPSTWQALGHSGLPENASVAEQNQAFQHQYARSGAAAWAPFDGC
jgi:Transglycosylase-like domain